MKRLKELVKYCELKIIHGGKCPMLNALSAEYKNKYQIPYNPFTYREKMNQAIGIEIANIYQEKAHEPHNKLVKAAYDQLKKEVTDQFMFLMDSENIQYEPFEGKGEPYADSYEMLMDIHDYHLYFFKTESGFGESEYTEENTMLHGTGIMLGDYELVVNDLFRIVHDIFGHAMDGNGFGPIGEDKAWFCHLNMFTPLAAAALSMETRGQNCWVNFGSHMRNAHGELYTRNDKNWLSPGERPFAEQKMNLLPSYITGIDVYEEGKTVKARNVKVWDPIQSVLLTTAS